MSFIIPLPINYSELQNFDNIEQNIIHQENHKNTGTFSLRRERVLANLALEGVYTTQELKNEFALLVNEIYKAKPAEKNLYTPFFSSINRTFDKNKLTFDDLKYVRNYLFWLTSRFYNNPEVYSRIVSLYTKLNKVMSQN
jgi:hypothetical protein